MKLNNTFILMLFLFSTLLLSGCGSEMTDPFVPEAEPTEGVLTFFTNGNDFEAYLTKQSPAGLDTLATFTADGDTVTVPFGSYTVYGASNDSTQLNGQSFCSINSSADHVFLNFATRIVDPAPPSNWVEVWLGESLVDTCYVGEELTIKCGSENAFAGHLTVINTYTAGNEFNYRFTEAGTYYFSYNSNGEVNPPATSTAAVVVLEIPVVPEFNLIYYADDPAINADEQTYLHWSTAGYDSVQVDGVRVAANDFRFISPGVDTAYRLDAWYEGVVRDTRVVTVLVTALPDPAPGFGIWCEHQTEPGRATVTRGEETQIGRTTIYENPGDYVKFNFIDTVYSPNGAADVLFEESCMVIGELWRDFEVVLRDTIVVTVVDEPVEAPRQIEIEIHFWDWVGSRPTDNHELVLVPDLILPDKTTRVQIFGYLRHSGEEQVNEAAAFGIINGSIEKWADIDGDGCPVFPDQPGVEGNHWFNLGTITGILQGQLVMRHAMMFPCYEPVGGSFEGPNSLWCKGLRLVIEFD